MAQIAREMGRSFASIKNRVFQDQVPSSWKMSRWLEVLMRSHTIAGAAEEMGLTKWAVKQAKRKLRRKGFPIPAAKRDNVKQGKD
jgi:hypothetical protein